MKIDRGRNGLAWTNRWRAWRIQFGYSVYKHTTRNFGDRWVIQPLFIYDRKKKRNG